MLKTWLKKRAIKKEIKRTRKRYTSDYKNMGPEDNESMVFLESNFLSEIEPLEAQLKNLNIRSLLKKALEYGIDVPKEWFLSPFYTRDLHLSIVLLTEEEEIALTPEGEHKSNSGLNSSVRSRLFWVRSPRCSTAKNKTSSKKICATSPPIFAI